MLLLWFPLVPVAWCELVEPQLDPGAFSPSTNWISDNKRNQQQVLGINNASAFTTRGTDEKYKGNQRCGCSCGQATAPPNPSAVISTVPTYLTLTCETPFPYEFISWWLYNCPNKRKIVQLTAGPYVIVDGFEVITGRSQRGYYSSLFIKDVSANSSSGLYQCVSHASSTTQHPFFSRTDYFVIGKRITMRDCLFDALTRNEFKRQIQNKLTKENTRQSRIDEIDSVNTVISFDFSDAIPAPVVQTELDIDLKPPGAQISSEIPVQTNSYVRFDFTGGQTIQNRNFSKIARI